jgi:O-antigen/teichoic acid export membrane protein
MISRLFGLMFARLISPLVSFSIIVMVARIWGQETLGEYNTIWVWLTLFQFFSVFGLGDYISREVGSNHNHAAKYQTHGLFIGLLFSLICIVIMIGGAILFKYPEDVKHGIMIASIILPFYTCTMICQAVFTAVQKIKYIGFACIVENALFLLMGAAVIIKGYGLINLVLSLVLARILGSGLNFLIAYKYIVRLDFKIDWKYCWKFLTTVTVFGVTGVASLIFLRIDVVILSKMTDMITVGLYSSASKLTEFCLILPLNFYALILPIAARGYQNFRESVHRKIETYTRQLFILVFLVFGFGFFFAEMILRLFYGKPFAEANWILRILMLAFLVTSADTVLSMSSLAAGYQKIVMIIAIVRAVVNIVLNFIFIPSWGAVGAALATLFSISLSFAILQYFVTKTLGEFRWIPIVRKPAIVSLSMMVLLFPLIKHLSILILGSLFLLGYAFFIFALNGFSFEWVKSPQY